MTEKETLKGKIHMTSHKSASGNTYVTADLDTGDNYPTRLVIFSKTLDDNPEIKNLQDKDVEVEAYPNQYNVVGMTATSKPLNQSAEPTLDVSDDDLPF